MRHRRWCTRTYSIAHRQHRKILSPTQLASALIMGTGLSAHFYHICPLLCKSYQSQLQACPSQRRAAHYREQACKLRKMADPEVEPIRKKLLALAAEYDELATALIDDAKG